jgi:hypothetical protein
MQNLFEPNGCELLIMAQEPETCTESAIRIASLLQGSKTPVAIRNTAKYIFASASLVICRKAKRQHS